MFEDGGDGLPESTRSSRFQQSGPVVCPAIAASLLGVLHGMDWGRVRDYPSGLYRKFLHRFPARPGLARR